MAPQPATVLLRRVATITCRMTAVTLLAFRAMKVINCKTASSKPSSLRLHRASSTRIHAAQSRPLLLILLYTNQPINYVPCFGDALLDRPPESRPTSIQKSPKILQNRSQKRNFFKLLLLGFISSDFYCEIFQGCTDQVQSLYNQLHQSQSKWVSR